MKLTFPYNHRLLLVGWQVVPFFRPGCVAKTMPGEAPEWNRGTYLVQGVGHCSACHESRNALGATRSTAGPSSSTVLN